MPGPILAALVACEGRLRASEQLMRIDAAAIGSGSVKQSDAKAYVASLQRQIEPPRRIGDMSAAMRVHVLASMGIRTPGG